MPRTCRAHAPAPFSSLASCLIHSTVLACMYIYMPAPPSIASYQNLLYHYQYYLALHLQQFYRSLEQFLLACPPWPSVLLPSAPPLAWSPPLKRVPSMPPPSLPPTLWPSSAHLDLLQSASQFCGVPVTFLNRGFVLQRKDARASMIKCMAVQKSLEVGADIIDKVKQDHKELEEAYSNYKKYHKQGNEEEAGKWFNQFVWEISRHAVTEELVLYPLIASQGEKGRKLADQSRDDPQQTKNMLVEIQNIKDDDKAFERKFDEIMHALREHISKEEKEDLVYLQQNVDQAAREAAGTTFALGKNIVPTKPHAAVPNRSAIVEGALGLFATPIDKLRDVFTPYPSSSSAKDCN